eukprot:TRINITY_DN22736_c1_g1_i1.p1 TRINITY_DN22736_c1_g1~~TRINITY_DN22736_c1_g1_i1.p1  ORF type:complete len:962 (-),score=103.27 TRINITY_DN22736_c1_g1_i1:80-2884(-)
MGKALQEVCDAGIQRIYLESFVKCFASDFLHVQGQNSAASLWDTLSALSGEPGDRPSQCAAVLQSFASAVGEILREHSIELREVGTYLEERRQAEIRIRKRQQRSQYHQLKFQMRADKDTPGMAIDVDINSQCFDNWNLPAPKMTVLEILTHTKKLRSQLALLSNLCGCETEKFWEKVQANRMQYSVEIRQVLIDMLYSRYPQLAMILEDMRERGKPSPNWLITGFQSGTGLMQVLYDKLQSTDAGSLPVLQYLFMCSMQPFLSHIGSWIASQQDPMPQYCIPAPEELIIQYQAKNSQDQTQDMQLLPSVSPGFLKSVWNMFVRSGQQLRFLSDCGNEYKSLVDDMMLVTQYEIQSLQQVVGGEEFERKNIPLIFEASCLMQVNKVMNQYEEIRTHKLQTFIGDKEVDDCAKRVERALQIGRKRKIREEESRRAQESKYRELVRIQQRKRDLLAQQKYEIKQKRRRQRKEKLKEAQEDLRIMEHQALHEYREAMSELERELKRSKLNTNSLAQDEDTKNFKIRSQYVQSKQNDEQDDDEEMLSMSTLSQVGQTRITEFKHDQKTTTFISEDAAQRQLKQRSFGDMESCESLDKIDQSSLEQSQIRTSQKGCQTTNVNKKSLPMTYSIDICVRQCIQSQYAWTSKLCISLIFQQHKFLETFESIQKIYCTQCGDFIDMFIGDLTHNKQASFLSIQSSFEDALRLSSFKNDQSLSKFKIIKKDDNDDEDADGGCLPCGIEVTCDIGWPLNSLITTKVIKKLNELFRQQLSWKLVLKRLLAAWNESTFRNFFGSRSMYCRYAFEIHRFLSNVVSYIDNDIEAKWRMFAQQVQKNTKDLVDLKQQIAEYVEQLTSQSRFPGCAECDMKFEDRQLVQLAYQRIVQNSLRLGDEIVLQSNVQILGKISRSILKDCEGLRMLYGQQESMGLHLPIVSFMQN